MVPSSHQIADLSVDQLHTAVEAGSLHPVAVVEHFLKRIEEKEDSVQAFVEVYADESLAVAQAQGDAIRAGQPGGPLRGVPFGVKDLYDVAGHPTRAGSLASSSEAVKLDSTAVARLRQAGAIVLGKTTTHEYAYGVATPPTRNPWDFSRIPGGSSGGSGAALAARFVPLALGSDTGGSIRIPAALCGVVGLKPTLGQVPTRGVQPCAWTLDHAGPMALTVRDAALALRQLVGPEQLVSGVSSPAVPDYPALLGDNIVGWKIGVAETYFCDRLAPDVASAFEVAIHRLEAAGAQIVPVRFPQVELCPDIVNVVASSEAASYHGSMPPAQQALLGPDVRAAQQAGQGYSATDYIAAQRARSAVNVGMWQVFKQVKVLVTPTIATTTPEAGATTAPLGDAVVPILDALNALTVPANVTGMPAITVPTGVGADGLPVGLQIMAPPLEELSILTVAHVYESLTEFSQMRPF